MYIAILGRQSDISLAELSAIYGDENVSQLNHQVAEVNCDKLDFEKLGGSQKAGKIIAEITSTSWPELSKKIIQHYQPIWSQSKNKITLGISAYGFKNLSAKQIQKTGLVLKSKLKAGGVSLRLIPNQEVALNTATSHHNKLGLSPNKIELLVIKSGSKTILAESCGAQNITALAARDQARPFTDAFVGMLPPKLARIMINLAQIDRPTRPTILDPFCGSGVILQEAALLGYNCSGTDLSPKMVDYSQKNLQWLARKYNLSATKIDVRQADAMSAKWTGDIDAVVCETYLGQPFSAPPSEQKLKEVAKNCHHIIDKFLSNIASQVESGTNLVIAVPAWRRPDQSFHHLRFDVQRYGLDWRQLNVQTKLLYCRDNQVVGRELLFLKKP